MFHLSAVERIIHHQIRDNVFALQNAMVALDVMKLDGEAVARRLELMLAKQQWRRIFLLTPPAEDGFGFFELPRRNLLQDADHVQV